MASQGYWQLQDEVPRSSRGSAFRSGRGSSVPWRCPPAWRCGLRAELCREVGAPDAIAFAYGRTAQWAFLQAVGVRDAEVVMPAYTCSVVAHAVTLSGNTPVFRRHLARRLQPDSRTDRGRDQSGAHRRDRHRTHSAIPRTPTASAPLSPAPRTDSATRSGWSRTVRMLSVRRRAATSWRRRGCSRSSV